MYLKFLSVKNAASNHLKPFCRGPNNKGSGGVETCGSGFFAYTPTVTNLLSPHRLPTHPGLARSLCLPVSYARTALCTRISRWLHSSHIGSIIHPSKNHLYLVSLFTSGLALPQSQLCHSNQSHVNEKQLLNTRVKYNTTAWGWSRISCTISNCPASIHLLLC